jgi:hypothetical protein
MALKVMALCITALSITIGKCKMHKDLRTMTLDAVDECHYAESHLS